MSGREYKVGVVGTFEVGNYGHLLLRLIAWGELAGRLGLVAPVGGRYLIANFISPAGSPDLVHLLKRQ
jgi:hypothetical protein